MSETNRRSQRNNSLNQNKNLINKQLSKMNVILRMFRQRSFLLVALLLMGCLQLLAQTRTIKGVVTDAQNGEALIGRRKGRYSY